MARERRPVTWTRWRNSARCRCPASRTWPPTHPPNPRPSVRPGRQARAPRADVRVSSQFFHLWLAQVASAPSATGSGFLAIAALAARIAEELAGGGRRPGHVGAHRPRVLPRRRVGRVRRPLRPQEASWSPATSAGPSVLVLPAVRRHRRSASWSPRSARVLHAAVDAGQGGVGPEPRAARPPHHRQLALAGRGLRHLARSPPASSRCSPGVSKAARRDRRPRRPPHQPGGHRVLRRRGHVPALGVHDLAAARCPKHERRRDERRGASTSGRPSTSSRRAGRSSSSTRWCGPSTSAWPPG